MINPIGKKHDLNLEDEKESKVHIARERTELRFVSFLSDGFITAIQGNV